MPAGVLNTNAFMRELCAIESEIYGNGFKSAIVNNIGFMNSNT